MVGERRAFQDEQALEPVHGQTARPDGEQSELVRFRKCVHIEERAEATPTSLTDRYRSALFTTEATNLHREQAKSGAYVCYWRWCGRKELIDGDAKRRE